MWGVYFAYCPNMPSPVVMQQRKKELVAAIVAVFNETIGDRAKDMFELAALATAPHKQGRGYATALVTTLNSMVSLWYLGRLRGY